MRHTQAVVRKYLLPTVLEIKKIDFLEAIAAE